MGLTTVTRASPDDTLTISEGRFSNGKVPICSDSATP